ncbi:MAG: FAD-dependent oxidoreductase [Nocardioides sp.]|uniref:FAD-dependent oxidoreductase n=1 Tax=Nocardioides sp. TaxID=35761 RepID=UPI003D6ABCC7
MKEIDVLVVGFGAAGAAASIAATSAGASVLVLERAGAPGGSAALSGGEIYLGGGTSVQQACGFSDTADDMYAFLSAALGPHADPAKLRHYCDGSVDHFDWLVSCGIDFQPSFFEGPTWMPPTTDGLMWLGENAWPFNEIAKPAPRGHRGRAPHLAGQVVMNALIAHALSVGVEVEVDTRATSLIVEDGRVVGVNARHYGDDLSFRARSVVLTTGGFVDNEQMLADHAPSLLGHAKVSDGLDDGSGITMAASIGAATRRMSVVEAAFTAIPEMVCRGMLVNGLGQRFINEDVYPGLYSHAALHQPGPCWVMIDEAGFDAVADAWGVRPSFAAETVEELAVDLDLPRGALEATVAAYNEGAANGQDPLFHKDSRWLRPLTGGLAAVDPRRGFHPTESTPSGTGFAGFTLGGLHTTVDGVVLSLAGDPIPGLFAAGRASSGMHGEGYISGTSLGDGTFFGRRAGRSAAV